MRCPDPPVHPAARSALRGPLLCAGALAVVGLSGFVASAAASLAAAFFWTVAAAAVVGVAAVYRTVRYWGWRKPAKQRTNIPAPAPVNMRALPAPRLAIGAARVVPGEVLGAAEADKVRP